MSHLANQANVRATAYPVPTSKEVTLQVESHAIKPLLIVAYYTNEDYKKESATLQRSLEALGIEHRITSLPHLRDWAENCRQKPSFIRKMLSEYGSTFNVLYVDSDAVLRSYPQLLDTVQADIALHQRPRVPQPQAGTVFVTSTPSTHHFLDIWVQLSSQPSELSDMEFLGTAIEASTVNVHWLPAEYCCIFDLTRRDFPNIVPVIEHFQASRRFKARASLPQGGRST